MVEGSGLEFTSGQMHNDSFDGHVNKAAGALLGGAVADALGWPTEFIKTDDQAQRIFGVSRVKDFRLWKKPTGGRFNTYIDDILPGDYSDDTQLTLCVARCILADGTFDVQRFSKTELSNWLDYARGAGGTITRAARAISRRTATWDNNFFSYESRGRKSDYTGAGANGAAMRVSPHALANAYDEPAALSGIWRDTVVTHGHPRALWGALLYGKTLLLLFHWGGQAPEQFLESLQGFVERADLHEINGVMGPWSNRWLERVGKPFFDAFDETRAEVLDLLSEVANSSQKPLADTLRTLGCFVPATKGSGTNTVVAALAIFSRYGGNYERAVLEAVNAFGSDTDTIAAMVGSMIGVHRGQEAVPDRWANQMQDYGYFIRTAEAMTRISMREAAANDLAVDQKRYESERQDRNIVSLTQTREVEKGQRVTHPVFGMGWVDEVSSQQIRKRGGGTMLLCRVAFDVGQSCVFHSYQRAP